MERKKVGEVFHFFGHIGVAAIRLTDGSLAVGDTVQIQGPTTNVEQPVDSLQIEHATVTTAAQGQEVGMKVLERVREKDLVYKLVPPTEGKAAPKAPRKAPAKKPTRRKKPTRAKKSTRTRKPAPSKKAKPARKASRAARSTKRRGSRKSRRRSR